MVNREEIERLGIEEPKDWDDLLKPEYKGLSVYPILQQQVQLAGHQHNGTDERP